MYFIDKSSILTSRVPLFDPSCTLPTRTLAEPTEEVQSIGVNHRGEKGRGEKGVYLTSQLERITNLLVVVDRVKGEGGVLPSPSPGWAEFTIMMECTP